MNKLSLNFKNIKEVNATELYSLKWLRTNFMLCKFYLKKKRKNKNLRFRKTLPHPGDDFAH